MVTGTDRGRVEREKSEAGRGRTSLTKLKEFRRRKAKRDRTGKQEIEDKEQNRKEKITGKEGKEHNRNRVYTKRGYPKEQGPVGTRGVCLAYDSL